MKRLLRSKITKTIIALAVCISILPINAFASDSSTTTSVNYTMIGTNAALNSPILNNQFANESWNKWEMVCWGVFLSNFCTPFIDDYESAFDSMCNRGSQGDGYRALTIAGGGDTQTIQNLCNYAISHQQDEQGHPIYVTFTDIHWSAGSPAKRLTPTHANIGDDAEAPAYAHLADILCMEPEGRVKGDEFEAYLTADNDDLEGRLPTFWVYIDGEYVKILDYTDWYDIQIPTLLMASLKRAGDDATEAAHKLFEASMDEYSDNGDDMLTTRLVMDCFGNICQQDGGNKIVIIPASANRNITSDGKINLMNSLVINGYSSTCSGETIKRYACSFDTSKALPDWNINEKSNSGATGKIEHVGGKIDRYSVVLNYDLRAMRLSKETTSFADLLECDLDNQVLDQDDGTNHGGITGNMAPFILSPVGFSSWDGGGITQDASWFSKLFFTKDSDFMLFARWQPLVVTGIFGSQRDTTEVLNSITFTDGSKVRLFTDPVCTVTNTNPSVVNGKKTAGGALRALIGAMYDCATANREPSQYEFVNASAVREKCKIVNVDEAAHAIFRTGGTKPSGAYMYFLLMNDDLYSVNCTQSQIDRGEAQVDDDLDIEDLIEPGEDVADIKFDYDDTIETTSGDGYLEDAFICKAYPISEEMMSVARVMGLSQYGQFSQYSAYIYMTYLDWYGVTKALKDSSDIRSGYNDISDFNTRIFVDSTDILQADISALTEAPTVEDVDTKVMNYAYLMLHPTEGRTYRETIINNWLTDFMYSQYNRICYGSASSSETSNVTNTASSGFFTINTYEENRFTAWFLRIYASLVVGFIAAMIIIIVVYGMIKKRRLSWFLVSLVAAVTSFLILPATGDIVPYVSNMVVSELFRSKMSHWAMNEAINNERIEAEYKNSLDQTAIVGSGLNKANDTNVVNTLKLIRAVGANNAESGMLMMRMDISQKTPERLEGNYGYIQELQTARAFLPAVMQQYSALREIDMENYVLRPVANIKQDMENLYFWYKPHTAPVDEWHGIDEQGNGGPYNIPESGKTMMQKTAENAAGKARKCGEEAEGVDGYYNYGYDIHDNELDLVHTYFYVLPEGQHGLGGGANKWVASTGYTGPETWKAWLENQLKTTGVSTQVTANNICEIYNEYDRSDISFMRPWYGYLWTTESPAIYFYAVARDTFPDTTTMAQIAGQLVGVYQETVDENGNATLIRDNFMYAPGTKYCRDIMDLEDVFYNMIPYMYTTTLVSCGFDEEVPGSVEGKVEGNGLYEDSEKSWMMRCNWVVKIMEDSNLATSGQVKDSEGNKYEVANMLIPQCYPDERPMVFSEAQMEMQGLTLYDLNLVETKCVEANKKTADEWSTLINYVNTDGCTVENITEQMGLDATLIFNQKFNTSMMSGGRYSLYPTSLDLRVLSYDALMKTLVINVNQEATMTYGNTMKSVIADSDMFTCILLFISCVINAWLVVIIRDLMLAWIFFLGLAMTLRSILAAASDKFRTCCGWFVTNIVFLAVNVAYFGAFAGLTHIENSEALVNVNAGIQIGSVAFILILTIVLGVAYITTTLAMMKALWDNRADMGMGMWSRLTGNIVGGISGAIAGIGAKINGTDEDGDMDDYSESTDGQRMRSTKRGAGRGVGSSAGSGGGGTTGTVVNTSGDDEVQREEQKEHKDYDNTMDTRDDSNNNSAEDIQSDIERGREIEDKEKKEQAEKERKEKAEESF